MKIISCKTIESVNNRLGRIYGTPQLRPTGDGIGELIATILSQNTTDLNSGRAYRILITRHPTWPEVAELPVTELASVISVAGLATQKASTIKSALQGIFESNVTIDSLQRLSVDEARTYLTSMRGVGTKTASCVLLFAYGMPAMPVDTHVHRVMSRIGNPTAKTAPQEVQDFLEPCLQHDAKSIYAFHLNVIRHGREVCVARSPRCSICPLTDLCDYWKANDDSGKRDA